MGAPKLPTLAKQIKKLWPRYFVSYDRTTFNTDRKIGRLRWPGKGREGYQLSVYKDWRKPPIFEHNSGETYRRNQEVVDWIEKHKRKPE